MASSLNLKTLSHKEKRPLVATAQGLSGHVKQVQKEG